MQSIEMNQVEKNFGNIKAINGLDITVQEGQVCAFLGHNGAGKTTTLRMLLGLVRQDKGSISVFGLDPRKNGDQIRAMCGVLSEEVGLYEPLSVYDNLMYFADIYGMPRNEANLRINSALEQFGIADKRDLPVKGFSTGMKKKTALIRAMLHRPRLLMLDEPTNGLDPEATLELREMLKKLAKESGATILLTTHNLSEVQKICDRIIIFRHGRNIFTGDIDILENDPNYQKNGTFNLEKLYLAQESGMKT
ncbi:ABC transporter ATP-binding protein [Enterococcus sp. LJL128]